MCKSLTQIKKTAIFYLQSSESIRCHFTITGNPIMELWWSYSCSIHNGISYTGEMASLYWISIQVILKVSPAAFATYILCICLLWILFPIRISSTENLLFLVSIMTSWYGDFFAFLSTVSLYLGFWYILCCWPELTVEHSIENTLRQRQNGHHFADDTWKCTFLQWKC